MKHLSALLLITTLTFSLPALADSTQKTIFLKDGSAIKGNVIKMENGVYTIFSERLGDIEIKDADIAGIQTENSNAVTADINPTSNPISSSDLKNQVNALQGSILSDPDMMKDITSLMSDPSIQALLSDKSFVNDVMSMDPNKLQNNQKVDQLMQNPKIQELMQKIQTHQANTSAK